MGLQALAGVNPSPAYPLLRIDVTLLMTSFVFSLITKIQHYCQIFC
jgi:hypothetical protein